MKEINRYIDSEREFVYANEVGLLLLLFSCLLKVDYLLLIKYWGLLLGDDGAAKGMLSSHT